MSDTNLKAAAAAANAFLRATDSDAEPPPNTVPVRVLVDVSPPHPPSGTRVVYVTKLEADQRGPFGVIRDGWERSIHLCHAPVPLPVVELHATLEEGS